jgi:hypothetical protein
MGIFDNVARQPTPGQSILFEQDPRRCIPVEFQSSFTQDEAYDLIAKFIYYDKDHSGSIDQNELQRILVYYDSDLAAAKKCMEAVDFNHDGLCEFGEFAALVSRLRRYRPDQLLGLKALKSATSSDAPTTFKTQGSAVVDRTMGANFPVVYDPDPRYRVKTPRDANIERSDKLIAKGTNVSYL